MREQPCYSCQLCGGHGSVLHEGLKDRLFGVAGEWNFLRCDNLNCGLVWLDPKPLECDLPLAYANYYTHNTTGSDSPTRRRIARRLERIWLTLLLLYRERNRIDHMYLESRTRGRLLEIGCGEGSLLSKLRERGWHVEGQEIDEKAAETARNASGATVHVGDLTALILPDDSYDAIVMNHVIEHAYNPLALVVQCRKLLKPGGILVATTPNIDSFGHKRFQQSWMQLDPPRHLHLFSLRALQNLARGAGFAEANVFTTAVRAGGILAASVDINRTGHHEMRGQVSPRQLLWAAWYQFLSRIAFLNDPRSGEEAVLLARKC